MDIAIQADSENNILEKIKKNIAQTKEFCHIVSINPENVIEARQNSTFKTVIESAQIQIIDGSGIVWAATQKGISGLERVTGVDLMEKLLEMAGGQSVRIMFIGGSPKVAERLADCYSQKYPKAKFLGITGIKNIKNPQKDEEATLFSIVADYMPQIVFVSFGSPAQELWIDAHKEQFKGMVCMGVGGAFDFLSGRVVRAPRIIRKLGMEWLFRLILQPWRFRRQLNLVKFIGLILTS